MGSATDGFSLVKKATERWAVCLALVLVLCASGARAATYPPAPWAEAGTGENLEVSLVTFGPGSVVPAWFGHTAIGVRDTRTGRARLYNYGAFGFSAGFVFEFIKGRLNFWVAPGPYEGTLRAYKARDRDVRIAVLNLSPKKRAEAAAFLEHNIRPENRTYLYHHYDDNCATRIRDLFDRMTDGQFKTAALAAKDPLTLRDHTRRYAAWSILEFGMSYAMGSALDQPGSAWTAMFLPDQLEAFARGFTYKNDAGEVVPLFASERIYHTSTTRSPTPAEVPPLAPWLFALGALGGLTAVWARRRYDAGPTRRTRILLGLSHAALGGLVGTGGLIVCAMWAFTAHTVVYNNQNVTLTSPLALVAAAAGLAFALGKTHLAPWITRAWLACSALAAAGVLAKLVLAPQNNVLALSLVLPVLAGATWSAWGLRGADAG